MKRVEVHCKDTVPKIGEKKFLDMKLRGLVPNSYIHVSVSDKYIPTNAPHIWCSKIGGPIVGIYTSFTAT